MLGKSRTKAVRIWADCLYVFGILARLTRTSGVVFPCTAIFGSIVLCACGEARIELWPLNAVVRIRVHAIARFLWRVLLQIPWTPLGDLILVHLLVKG